MEYTAVKIPADGSGCGWYEILPPPPAPKILETSIKADWTIVGAGFAGLTAAKRITDSIPEAKVVVLDAQRVGWGASGRNSGFMIDLPHDVQSESYSGEDNADKKQIRMNRFAIDYAKSMIDEFGLQQYSSNSGKISAAADHAGIDALGKYAKHLELLGEPFTRLDNRKLQSVTGTDYYREGIHTPGCLLIQPAGYIRGLAGGLKKNAAIYENSPVCRIQTGLVQKVFTPGGVVESDKIILTLNGHLESFGLYPKKLMHTFLCASMTRQLTEPELSALGGDPEWGITPAHPMGSTVRRTREGRILVRNSIFYDPGLKASSRQIKLSARNHETSFRRRFPMLSRVEMQYRWGGHLCLSRNSVPVFGEIEKGFYVACCQNGLGAAKGTLSGALIVDLAAGNSNPLVGEFMDCDRPKKLIPEPFMSIGAKAYLWWGRNRAGKDF